VLHLNCTLNFDILIALRHTGTSIAVRIRLAQRTNGIKKKTGRQAGEIYWQNMQVKRIVAKCKRNASQQQHTVKNGNYPLSSSNSPP